jgi:probable rRNA maturation factor
MVPNVSIRIATSVNHAGWDRSLPAAARIGRLAARRAIRAALLSAALKEPRLRTAGRLELGLVLEGDAAMRRLNRIWRGNDQATNVLSFASLDAGPPPRDLPHACPWALGDVVLALGTIRAEAKAQGKKLAQHYCHLVVHGVLHLLGFDHQAGREARLMEGLERATLASLGWPDPYR